MTISRGGSEEGMGQFGRDEVCSCLLAGTCRPLKTSHWGRGSIRGGLLSVTSHLVWPPRSKWLAYCVIQRSLWPFRRHSTSRSVVTLLSISPHFVARPASSITSRHSLDGCCCFPDLQGDALPFAVDFALIVEVAIFTVG